MFNAIEKRGKLAKSRIGGKSSVHSHRRGNRVGPTIIQSPDNVASTMQAVCEDKIEALTAMDC